MRLYPNGIVIAQVLSLGTESEFQVPQSDLDYEIDTAERLVRLISERGYHRGKNLVEDFSRYKARFLGP
jgi:hypothetical protein